MNIKSTTKYDQFTHMRGNRDLQPNHVKSLVQSIAKNNLLESNPIIVNQNGLVIDGQHRLEAAKQLGVPVSYVVTDGNLDIVQKLNTSAKSWSYDDFVNSYIELGNKNYIELQEFKKKWGISYGLAGSLMMFGPTANVGGTSNKDYIKSGKFKIKYAEYADGVMQWVDAFSEFADAVVRRNRSFITAVIQLKESGAVSFANLKHKLAVHGRQLVRMNTKSDYLRQLEEIINFKARKDHVRLF
ncbi:MAG: hypothetical protein KCHDKBKB_00649 [Elusimicrobia bacterium]|nr:hypothetical protein [Elusimicrobiota bacterium]